MRRALASSEEYKYQDVIKLVKDMPEPVFNYVMEKCSQGETVLLDNRAFVSDSEAADLSWLAGHQVIQVKSCLLGVIGAISSLMITCRYSDHLSQQVVGAKVFPVIRGMIELGRLHLPLLKYLRKVRKHSLLYLTCWQSIWCRSVIWHLFTTPI
jgi:hypothetical protein